MNKTKISILVLVVVLVLGLFIVGSLMDLTISNNLFMGDENVLALLGGMVGKVPMYAILAFAFMVLANYAYFNKDKYKKKAYATTLVVCYSLAMLCSFFMLFYSAFEELTSKALYIGAGAGIVALCIAVVAMTKRQFNHGEELKKWAFVTILALGIMLIIVAGVKVMWGRLRYIDMVTDGGKFQAWYQPDWFGGGHSFPSGHTALWGALYMLIPLLAIFGYKGEAVCYLGVIVTQLIVGMFRVVGGHHYLTDITVSIAISFAVTFVVTLLCYKRDYSNATLSEKSPLRLL